MNIKGKIIVVTGGCGFIGSHLVQALIKEDPRKIIVIDNLFLHHYAGHPIPGAILEHPLVELMVQDAGNEPLMNIALKDIDICFNLAVQPLPHSLDEPTENFRNNVEIVQTLLNLARFGTIKRLVHFSSSEVYGSCQNPPMAEDHPFGPSTPYAASKAAGDLLVLSYWGMYPSLDAVIIRPFNNYGPRQNEGTYAGVIPRTINLLMKGRMAEITGDGTQTRDYIYVKDTARAAILVAERGRGGEVFNVASGKEVAIKDLVQRIISIYAHLTHKHAGSVRTVERSGDVKRHLGSGEKIKEKIGFVPEIGIEEGLETTIKWYLKM